MTSRLKVYKTTSEDGRTRGPTQWGEDVTHETDGTGDLCGPGWLHAYPDLLLGVMMAPSHVPGCDLWWEAEANGEIRFQPDELGCTRLTTVRRLPPGEVSPVTVEQCVRFGIGAAAQVCRDKAWRRWAGTWLAGNDRTRQAAAEAATVASRAGAAAAWAAGAAALAAEAAMWAATAAATAAATRRRKAGIDLIAIARWAVSDETYPPGWSND